MTLRERQSLFTHLLGRLLLQAEKMGYETTLGEAWRPKITVEAYAKSGKGSRNSVHPLRLAVDLNLFKEGVYLRKTEDHRPLGEWWEKQHELCRWGGRFKRRDGNHYSLVYGKRAY